MTERIKKVSCLCMTKNRTEFLPTSIRCFEQQDYPEKELLIFYESSDEPTKAFISNNPQYNQVRFEHKHDLSKGVFFECDQLFKKTVPPLHEERIKIGYGNNLYLQILPNQSIGTSDVKKTDGAYSETFFTCYLQHEQNYSFKTEDGLWLKAEKDGTLSLAKECNEWETFRIEKITDCTFRIISWHEFKYQSKIQVKLPDSIAWEKEEIQFSNSLITFVELKKEEKLSLGAKRNIGVTFSESTYICIWDDDDWHNPTRISSQLNTLEKSGKAACTLKSIYLYDQKENKFYSSIEREEGWEGTLLCKKENISSYDNLPSKEDTIVLRRLKNTNNLITLNNPYLYIYFFHSKNTSSENHLSSLKKKSILLENFQTDLFLKQYQIKNFRY